MKKVLVTGGLGYIGSHTVVELLEEKYQVVIIDDLSNSELWILDRISEIAGQRPTFYEGDCADKDFLNEVFEKEKDISSVIHFAAKKSVAESIAEPLEYYRNNVGATINLLEVMKERGVKELVFSSSATVYGEQAVHPIPETAKRQQPTSPYGMTKLMCEDIVVDTTKSTDLAAVMLRYFNPVGAHASALIGELPKGIPNNLVPYVTQTAAGIRESLTIFGDDYETEDGTCVRDFIHVVDLAQAHLAALRHLENAPTHTCDTYNVGTGKGDSVMGLLKEFEAVTGAPLRYSVGPRRAGDIMTCYADVQKINSELNWHATHTLSEALADAWRWQQTLKTSE